MAIYILMHITLTKGRGLIGIGTSQVLYRYPTEDKAAVFT